MLNELQEAEAYLRKPDSDDTRLKAQLLSDDFDKTCKLNGIADVLTMVVRRYLDLCKSGKAEVCESGIADENTEENTEEMAILIMRVWCGFDGDVTEAELKRAKDCNQKWFQKYPKADGWLRAYHEKHLKGKCGSWQEYSGKWKKILNSQLLYQAESICFGNILAQAIAGGGLKTYYLVMNKAYEETLATELRNPDGKMPGQPKQKNILKILAAYKVLQRVHPQQKFVLLQTNRILNWMGFESDREQNWCLNITWRGEPLFTKDGGSDYKKICVNQDFLKEMDVHLQESKTIPDGCHVYEDIGHGRKKALKRL